MATLAMLRKQRVPVRTRFTKIINELRALLASEEKDHRLIRIKLTVARGSHDELKHLDEQILGASLVESTDEEYNNEKISIDAYEDQWAEINDDVSSTVPSSLASTGGLLELPPSVAGGEAETKKKNYKLPKIIPKTFNGEIKEWLGFWSQFKKIHQDPHLHDVDKFQYLMQAMEKGSVAYEIVSPFPLTEANYPKAVNALEERFGNEHVLCFFYIRELLRLIVTCSQTTMPVSRIFDQVNTQLQALQSLNVTEAEMDRFLYPMVITCLPEETIVAFQRKSNVDIAGKEKFKQLMTFLRTEVIMEQERGMARDGLLTPSSSSKVTTPEAKEKSTTSESKEERNPRKRKYPASEKESPTTAGLFVGHKKECIFCGKSHSSQECGVAKGLSLSEKEKKIMAKSACFQCLVPGHLAQKCKAYVKCIICSKRHQTLMCPTLPENQKDHAAKKDPQKVNYPKQPSEKSWVVPGTEGPTTVNLCCKNSILLKTVVVRVRGNGCELNVRLFLDDGSQGSYVRKETVKRLNLRPVGEEQMQVCVFGGQTSALKTYEKYELDVESLDGKSRISIPVLAENEICGQLPFVPPGPWIQELREKKIVLTDQWAMKPDIDILVGSDLWGRLMTGKMELLSSGLIAMETVFGWTVSGPVPKNTSVSAAVIMMCAQQFSETDVWDLEILNIKDPIHLEIKKERDWAVLEHFKSTVGQNEDGRYVVALPWVERDIIIPSNREVALKRLQNATQKLRQAGKVEQYGKIFNEWESEKMIETVTDDSSEVGCHYLPHRPVFKPQSRTTPIRPVFDASCQQGRNPSLNHLLEKGPNLIELIPSVLLRFREKQIGVVADIRKAFQMISVNPKDRKVLRFLWWEDPSCTKVKVYQHTRVVFGVNCSPFLLQAVINHHLSKVALSEQETAQQLLKSLYVDNCVTSVDSHEKYYEFKKKAISFMEEAKMELREWEATGIKGESETPVSVLGYLWDKEEDEIRLSLGSEVIEGVVTKKKILSFALKIYDPLGFASPTTLQPKILLQKLWACKLKWDAPVPEPIKEEFLQWVAELSYLQGLAVPRQLMMTRNHEKIQIHCFVDACQLAYAAVIFIRCELEGEVTVRFVESKSRVAPNKKGKKGSIPRLELLACLIGARLTKSVVDALELIHLPVFYWSDSTTALAWISRNVEWGTFVGNRVKEIIGLTKVEDWRHVPGSMNPADLPSRGCNPKQLLNSRWWEGPAWLLSLPSEWPMAEKSEDESLIQEEAKKQVAVASASAVAPKFQTKFSSFRSNVRVLGWMLKFYSKCRSDCENPKPGRKRQCLTKRQAKARAKESSLSREEKIKAELLMFKIIQAEGFPKSVKLLSKLKTVMKDDGLIHVETKLLNGEESEFFKWPILLPSQHFLVNLLIHEIHKDYGHAGAQACCQKNGGSSPITPCQAYKINSCI